jgi:L-ascorbate metabolism protein UlaG (beta-lactamase superfamily)
MKQQRKKPARRGIRLTWFGHSCFLIESQAGRRILIDPWLENPMAPPGAREAAIPDLILLTHGHSDHVGNAPDLARTLKVPLYAIHELAGYLHKEGTSTAVGMNISGSVVDHGVTITMVEARHSGGIETQGGFHPGGEAAGFVIRMEDGMTVYHAGDTGVFGDMRLIGQLYKPTVALLPIGGFYTMGPREAALACRFLAPRVIIGMHYGTYPILAGTPAALRRELPPAMRNRVRELVPGTPMEL